MRGLERYRSWVALVRSGENDQIRRAVIEMEERLRTIGLSGGERRLLERARELLDDPADGS